MAVDEQAEKDARAKSLELKEEWKKIIATLRDVQVKPEEDKYYRNKLWQEKDGFKYRLGNYISIESYREALGIFKEIYTDLDLALRRGQEYYEQEKHKRRLELIKALRLGTILIIIVFAVIFVIVKIVYNIEIPFFH